MERSSGMMNQINQRSNCSDNLRQWLTADLRRSRARLNALIPAETPEEELRAANLTGRCAALEQVRAQIKQRGVSEMKWDKLTELMNGIKDMISALDTVLAEAADAEREARKAEPEPQPGPGEIVLTSRITHKPIILPAKGLHFGACFFGSAVQHGLGQYLVNESPGQIQALVDAALDALAEGATPRLANTVVLQTHSGMIEWVRIDRMESCDAQYPAFVKGAHTRVHGRYRRECDEDERETSDSFAGLGMLCFPDVAEVTAAARALWPTFSCPGCVDPFVMLSYCPPGLSEPPFQKHFRAIDRLYDAHNSAQAEVWVDGINTNGCKDSMRVKGTEAEVRAAAAKAGVPCVAKEPQVFVGVDPAAEGTDKSVCVMAGQTAGGEPCVAFTQGPSPEGPRDLELEFGDEGVYTEQDAEEWGSEPHYQGGTCYLFDTRVAELQQRVAELKQERDEALAKSRQQAEREFKDWLEVCEERDEARKRVAELEKTIYNTAPDAQERNWLSMRNERDEARMRVLEIGEQKAALERDFVQRGERIRAVASERDEAVRREEEWRARWKFAEAECSGLRQSGDALVREKDLAEVEATAMRVERDEAQQERTSTLEEMGRLVGQRDCIAKDRDKYYDDFKQASKAAMDAHEMHESAVQDWTDMRDARDKARRERDALQAQLAEAVKQRDRYVGALERVYKRIETDYIAMMDRALVETEEAPE